MKRHKVNFKQSTTGYNLDILIDFNGMSTFTGLFYT